MSFLSKLEEIENRYQELERELSSPEIYQDREKYTELAKAHSDLSDIVATFREYKKCQKELEENRELSKDSDKEIQELAQQEIEELEPRIEKLEHQLRSYLIPRDPLDEKSVILEIRAGTGGEVPSDDNGDEPEEPQNTYRYWPRYALYGAGEINIEPSTGRLFIGLSPNRALAGGAGGGSSRYSTNVFVQNSPNRPSYTRLTGSGMKRLNFGGLRSEEICSKEYLPFIMNLGGAAGTIKYEYDDLFNVFRIG